ncbi:MAG: UvrD-helicase domain-containing protein [Novosphingobium sp.]|uniref:UvrD-helicase domain-containing protein n=1 Tax=Novosphingobium sp. TaxID=1874826 RepID=UPI0032BC1DAA
MKSLVISVKTLFRLSQYSISDEWFDCYGIPEGDSTIKQVVVNDIAYLIEPDLDSDDEPVVVINLAEDNVFGHSPSRSVTLERIITVGRSIYTNSVSIPTGWRKHHDETTFSIQAASIYHGWKPRLHFETRPRGTKDLFAFSRTEETVNFADLDHHLDIYDAAKAGLAEAILSKGQVILSQDQQESKSSRAGITLSQRLPQGFVQGASLEEWYDTKLTSEQRGFVDKAHDGPVRLRGAAGTGKTLSLVIKFLRDSIAQRNCGAKKRIGFITHSFASADHVSSICESLDHSGIMHSRDAAIRTEIRTLYDVANEYLNFDLDQLTPLSLDGREGRKLQMEIIEAVLKEIFSSNLAQAQFSGLSDEIMQRWVALIRDEDKRFVSEVMNEFASVLDAEGIRSGEDKGEKYARGTVPRATWLMNLPAEIDRRFLLEIHRRYRVHLGEMNTISVDQMIGDFNSFLDFNRWDRIRDREGYDVIFVDELHLFTSVERQTLHKIMKRNFEEDGRPCRPPIFMAYDLKQSPRDTFASYDDGDYNLFSSSTGLQGADLVKLERVFRYTPQIAEFLSDLDASFPAIDIPGEWDAYSGKAELDSGATPTLTVFRTEVDLFSAIFSEAQKIARSIEGGGRRVAVLCVSEEQFDKYLTAASGQFSGRHLPITSREPSSELRHAGKRFVFSMPEYVAGLQFDTVFLIHVDASEAPLDSGDGMRRRFISNIYLGSSRAENTLQIAACLARGGKSDVLDMAIARKSIIEKAPPIAKKK